MYDPNFSILAPGSSKGGERMRAMVPLIVAIGASLAIYAVSLGSPLTLLPMFGFAILRLFPKLGARADQAMFLSFLVVCFFIDDASQIPWGRDIETWTEQLSILLFESFGLTGMELFALGFSGFLILSRPPQQRARWFKLGLKQILWVASVIMLTSYLAGIPGLAAGGNLSTFFIQVRFLHNLILWTFIGFVLLRDTQFTDRMLFTICMMVVLKSAQALVVYFNNRDILREAEYLIEHQFSAFSVLALLALARYAYRTRNPLLWPIQGMAMAIVLSAYLLNDRRTSYVGFILAGTLVPLLMPKGWVRQRLSTLLPLALLGLLYVGATWNMPAPLGFVGATIQSFGKETGDLGPSYRDLENANLMRDIAENPTTGLGYGREFTENYLMPDISFIYKRYRMVPHNLFLASWTFGGPLTAAATSLLFVVMIWLSGRLMREGKDPSLWFFGLASLFYSLQYFSYVFGDIGLQVSRNQMLAGIMLGGCCRLLHEHLGENVGHAN